MKASTLVGMIDDYPELALQNRQDMIKKKIELIQEYNPNLTKIYVRNLVRRHPDMFLKSFASMQAKIKYLSRNMNRQLQKEKAFPLLLHYNFTKHIWPRCEVLRDFGMKNFDLVDTLTTTDEEFCKKFDVTPAQLKQKAAKKAFIEEKD